MARYLLLASLFLMLSLPATAAGMELEEMMGLPGAELLTFRANEVIEALGPPAAIRDHGGKEMPRHQVRMNRERAALSDAPWNLIYGRFPAGNTFDWVNPRPQAPEGMEDLDTLVVYTHSDPDVVEIDEQSGELSWRKAADKLEEHAIYGVATIPTRSIPWEEFVRRCGPPDEQTTDEKRQPVSRYWVSFEVDDFPLTLFAVDALRGPRGDVLSVAIYNARTGFVAERLARMWEEQLPEEPQEPEVAPPPEELAPPEIAAPPGTPI